LQKGCFRLRPGTKEKRLYWERRLRDLLEPLRTTDLLVVSWALEAMRDGQKDAARKHLEIPGSSRDHQIGGKFFIQPWSVDAILRDKLTYTPTAVQQRRLNISSWNGVAKLMNVYARLSNVESVMDYDSSDIIPALQRLLWPQYDWQATI